MGVNTTRRILGEARKARPPTKSELTDPKKAYFYAFEKISRRFPEGEAAIATSPYWSYHYARRIIRGRWPEAEEAIAKDPEDAKFYLEHFPDAKLEWAMKGWLDWLDL